MLKTAKLPRALLSLKSSNPLIKNKQLANKAGTFAGKSFSTSRTSKSTLIRQSATQDAIAAKNTGKSAKSLVNKLTNTQKPMALSRPLRSLGR